MPVDLEMVRHAVEAVLKTGLRPARLVGLSPVLDLKLVRTNGGSDNPLDLAFAAEAAFRDAIDRLGNGPYGHAARLLFGADQESRGLPLKTRRRLAAEELEVYPATFRKLYEAELCEDVAVEFFRTPHPS